MKVLSNILLGLYLLCQSPSGIFACFCLTALSVVTWHLGAVGAMAAAWSAFFAVVPAILIFAEHKEQMQTNLINNPQPPAPPVVIIDNPRGQP